MGFRAGKATFLLILALVAGLMLVVPSVASPAGFDVRQHLSTTSRYGAGKAVSGIVEDVPPVPAGCEPIHLNLVVRFPSTGDEVGRGISPMSMWGESFWGNDHRAEFEGMFDDTIIVNELKEKRARHGTRSPTIKRIGELGLLVSRLVKHLEDNPEGNERRPAWLHRFRSPWEGRKVGGELIQEGEEAMYHLGQRIRERFPQLFKYDYHPEIYPITATQVPRSAASAVAFGMGLFEGKGTLGGSKQRAFSVITDSRKDDIHLRFHESCMAYKESKNLRRPDVQKWQDEIYVKVGDSVSARHALNLTTEDAASLWLLCKQEAATLDITDRACGLFNAAEVELLEWADDFQAHHLKGYGEAVNYRMGVPLLQDVVTTMERAISASEGHEFDGALQVAKLRIAHAETVIPFTCLLGLFLDAQDVKSLQSEEPLKYAIRPPQQRTWKGSLVAPFGANTQLVLYKCPKDSQKVQGASDADMKSSEYLVQVLHNEKPVTMPACNGAHLCPFTEFKVILRVHLTSPFFLLLFCITGITVIHEFGSTADVGFCSETVAGPHLKHSFEKTCAVETAYIPPEKSWAQRFVSGIRNLFQWPRRQSPDSCSIQSHVHKEL